MDRYYKIKAELTEMLGGKCSICGSTDNLHFDHKDPQSRSFKIGKLLNYKREKVLEEIKKCQLLCRNCHTEKSKVEGSLTKNVLRGSSVGGSKLTEDLVKSIKLDIKEKIKFKELAKKYNVSLCTIKFISCGISWKHVTI